MKDNEQIRQAVNDMPSYSIHGTRYVPADAVLELFEDTAPVARIYGTDDVSSEQSGYVMVNFRSVKESDDEPGLEGE